MEDPSEKKKVWDPFDNIQKVVCSNDEKRQEAVYEQTALPISADSHESRSLF